ncbi:MAG: hypothetical protein ACPG5P_03750, partial [Saprospiraceae bacterium]
MFKYVPVINFFVLFALLLQGQSFTPRTFPVIGHQGQLLENPFSGGLDTPQFSETDVNNDGLQDIY